MARMPLAVARRWRTWWVLGCFIARLGAAEAESRPPLRIYLANDDHTDFMWTADEDTYANVFVDLLDFHLALADQTAVNPVEFRNRFNADCSLWLSTYEKRKSSAEFARLMERIKDGTISVPLNTVVSCYGAQPLEAVLRGMYYAGRIERRYGLRFDLAVAMENQTLPLGLASLFAGSGARYSWRGVCGCASKLPNRILGDREHEIYWYTGHDGQHVLLKWYSLGPQGIGGYWEAGDPSAAIRYLTSDRAFRQRYVNPVTRAPYTVMGAFGFGGDDLARKTGQPPPPTIPAVPGLAKVVSSPYRDHFHVIAQRETTSDRQVIVSNETDFFSDFERTHGASLPSKTVTFGNEWDLYSASMSETSARAKRAVEKLRSAEMLATLVGLKYPAFMSRHSAARDRGYTALGLFWEHNWTADGPISRGQRAAWENRTAAEIEYYVDSLQSEALIRLGGMIPQPDKSQRFFVFNSLGWTRSGAADFNYQGATDIRVRDVASGEEVPHQLVVLEGARCLRILARDVPSAGYRVYEILPGSGKAAGDDLAASIVRDRAFTVENAAIRIVVEPDGSLSSLIDKRRGDVELAATIDGLAINDLAPGTTEGEPLVIENAGPVSVTIRARSGAGLGHSTAITVYRDSERIDLRNEITQNFANVRHWAFGFALASPAVRTEEVGAINLNKLVAEGGDYAPTHARYDYVTLNHFADIVSGDGAHGVTLSNADLAFAKLGRSTITSLDATTPQINVLAGGQVDGGSLGIRAQNGETHFLQRFALRPHGGYNSVDAMTFALDHQNPFVTGAVIGKETGPYPGDTFSFVEVGNRRVLLWAVKPAEEGAARGVVVRLWNLADQPQTTSVRLMADVEGVWQTTHIETDLAEMPRDTTGAISARFARQQLQTFRFVIK